MYQRDLTRIAARQYAIPKIKMLCSLHCLKARLRLLCNKYHRHSSLNLVSQQLKLCKIFIFGIAYFTLTLFAQCFSDEVGHARKLRLLVVQSPSETFCSILVCKIPRSFERASPSKFRTQGSFIHINSGKTFERDLLSSDSVAKSATQKPWVF